jgi:hypothetical protein
VITLNHTSPQSIIRRPSGLSDSEWDYLIETSIENFSKSYKSGETFMRELVKIAVANGRYHHILDLLGISKKSLPYQNWEHTAFRFYRHFCPEDIRNALGHVGMPHAVLTYNDQYGFHWVSIFSFNVAVITVLFEELGIKQGERITVRAIGSYTLDKVIISIADQKDIDYYNSQETMSKSFGDLMYPLKRSIVKTRKAR